MGTMKTDAIRSILSALQEYAGPLEEQEEEVLVAVAELTAIETESARLAEENLRLRTQEVSYQTKIVALRDTVRTILGDAHDAYEIEDNLQDGVLGIIGLCNAALSLTSPPTDKVLVTKEFIDGQHAIGFRDAHLTLINQGKVVVDLEKLREVYMAFKSWLGSAPGVYPTVLDWLAEAAGIEDESRITGGAAGLGNKLKDAP